MDRKKKGKRLLITAVNSKYIHSNLAVYSLQKYARQKLGAAAADIEIAEYTINQTREKILMDIVRKSPDVLFFSCYIWNIEIIRSLTRDLAKVRPEMDIWLGGPEVSHHSRQLLESMPEVRGIIRGEGERAFSELSQYYVLGKPALEEIGDLTIRELDFDNAAGPRMDLDEIDFVYENMEGFANRIVYYESSRGCPFRCSYCLSAVDKKLAFRSLEKVFGELQFFLNQRVPQVKFIDRTFNCRHDHALAIWRYIREHDNGVTNFHFEIAADLLNEEELELLGSLRPGLVQLEIGVQSTNPRTIQAIHRPMDFEKVAQVTQMILEKGNVHVHLDLIAGLPYEDMGSFRKSFNDVFGIRPHQLQLGFLKVLKGSPMEAAAPEYGLAYSETPPYEVLQTKWISFAELSVLKGVDEMVDVYYNSGQFGNSLNFLLQRGTAGRAEMAGTALWEGSDDFGLFAALAEWYRQHGLEDRKLNRNSRYEVLQEFGLAHLPDGLAEAFRQQICLDYYLRDNLKSRPAFLGPETVGKVFLKEFYAREAEVHRVLKGSAFDGADSRTLRNLTHLEMMDGEMVLFDYTWRDPVSGNVRMIPLTEGVE